MSNGEVLNKLAGIIPQGYFDLIARVLPGFVLLAITHWVFTGDLVPVPRDESGVDAESFLFFAAVAAFSYGIGLALNTLGPVFVALDATWQWLLLSAFHDDFTSKFIKDNSLDERLYLPWKLREYKECLGRNLKRLDPSTTSVNIKVKGEVVFFNNLALGCAALLILTGRLGIPQAVPQQANRVLWLILVFTTVSAGYRSWRLMMRFQRYLMSDK